MSSNFEDNNEVEEEDEDISERGEPTPDEVMPVLDNIVSSKMIDLNRYPVPAKFKRVSKKQIRDANKWVQKKLDDMRESGATEEEIQNESAMLQDFLEVTTLEKCLEDEILWQYHLAGVIFKTRNMIYDDMLESLEEDLVRALDDEVTVH